MRLPPLDSPEYAALLADRASKIRLPHQARKALVHPIHDVYVSMIDRIEDSHVRLDGVEAIVAELQLGWSGRLWRNVKQYISPA